MLYPLSLSLLGTVFLDLPPAYSIIGQFGMPRYPCFALHVCKMKAYGRPIAMSLSEFLRGLHGSHVSANGERGRASRLREHPPTPKAQHDVVDFV